MPAWAVSDERLVSALSDVQSVSTQNSQAVKLFFVLEKGLRSYGSLQNYSATFHKKEGTPAGALGETEEIYLKFEKPWKIFMGWLNMPKKGLQVVYEKGKNDGKLAVHQPGPLLLFAPVIFLDLNSPWVKEGSSSHGIEDAGIGTFLHDFTRAVVKASYENTLKVHFNQDTADVIFSDKPNPGYFAHRVRAGFDQKTGLPLTMELFDDSNQPTGIYEYKNLQLNVSEDEEFKKQIHSGLLKVYSHET